jgi:hypothetical protein
MWITSRSLNRTILPDAGKVGKESASHLNLPSPLSINASVMDERSCLTFTGLG